MTTTRGPELHNGILTKWVPLTTAGVASLSPACSKAIYFQPDSDGNLAGYDPWYGQNVDTNLQSCLVKEQTQYWDQSGAPSTLLNLGPFSCPSGYTTAATSLVDSDTLVGCCPE
jgi:hypothetical protein